MTVVTKKRSREIAPSPGKLGANVATNAKVGGSTDAGGDGFLDRIKTWSTKAGLRANLYENLTHQILGKVNLMLYIIGFLWLFLEVRYAFSAFWSRPVLQAQANFLKTEAGFYYSFYDQFVRSPTLSQAFYDILYDDRSEYPSVINALNRFNIWQEVICGLLYRCIYYGVAPILLFILSIAGKQCVMLFVKLGLIATGSELNVLFADAGDILGAWSTIYKFVIGVISFFGSIFSSGSSTSSLDNIADPSTGEDFGSLVIVRDAERYLSMGYSELSRSMQEIFNITYTSWYFYKLVLFLLNGLGGLALVGCCFELSSSVELQLLTQKKSDEPRKSNDTMKKDKEANGIKAGNGCFTGIFMCLFGERKDGVDRNVSHDFVKGVKVISKPTCGGLAAALLSLLVSYVNRGHISRLLLATGMNLREQWGLPFLFLQVFALLRLLSQSSTLENVANLVGSLPKSLGSTPGTAVKKPKKNFSYNIPVKFEGCVTSFGVTQIGFALSTVLFILFWQFTSFILVLQLAGLFLIYMFRGISMDSFTRVLDLYLVSYGITTALLFCNELMMSSLFLSVLVSIRIVVCISSRFQQAFLRKCEESCKTKEDRKDEKMPKGNARIVEKPDKPASTVPLRMVISDMTKCGYITEVCGSSISTQVVADLESYAKVPNSETDSTTSSNPKSSPSSTASSSPSLLDDEDDEIFYQEANPKSRKSKKSRDDTSPETEAIKFTKTNHKPGARFRKWLLSREVKVFFGEGIASILIFLVLRFISSLFFTADSHIAEIFCAKMELTNFPCPATTTFNARLYLVMGAFNAITPDIIAFWRTTRLYYFGIISLILVVIANVRYVCLTLPSMSLIERPDGKKNAWLVSSGKKGKQEPVDEVEGYLVSEEPNSKPDRSGLRQRKPDDKRTPSIPTSVRSRTEKGGAENHVGDGVRRTGPVLDAESIAMIAKAVDEHGSRKTTDRLWLWNFFTVQLILFTILGSAISRLRAIFGPLLSVYAALVIVLPYLILGNLGGLQAIVLECLKERNKKKSDPNRAKKTDETIVSGSEDDFVLLDAPIEKRLKPRNTREDIKFVPLHSCFEDMNLFECVNKYRQVTGKYHKNVIIVSHIIVLYLLYLYGSWTAAQLPCGPQVDLEATFCGRAENATQKGGSNMLELSSFINKKLVYQDTGDIEFNTDENFSTKPETPFRQIVDLDESNRIAAFRNSRTNRQKKPRTEEPVIAAAMSISGPLRQYTNAKIVMHPHYESAELRRRVQHLYAGLYHCPSPKDFAEKIMAPLKATHIVVELGRCIFTPFTVDAEFAIEGSNCKKMAGYDNDDLLCRKIFRSPKHFKLNYVNSAFALFERLTYYTDESKAKTRGKDDSKGAEETATIRKRGDGELDDAYEEMSIARFSPEDGNTGDIQELRMLGDLIPKEDSVGKKSYWRTVLKYTDADPASIAEFAGVFFESENKNMKGQTEMRKHGIYVIDIMEELYPENQFVAFFKARYLDYNFEKQKPALERYKKAFKLSHKVSNQVMDRLDEGVESDEIVRYIEKSSKGKNPTNHIISVDFLMFLDTMLKDKKESRDLVKKILASGYDWSSISNVRLLCDLAVSVKQNVEDHSLGLVLFKKTLAIAPTHWCLKANAEFFPSAKYKEPSDWDRFWAVARGKVQVEMHPFHGVSGRGFAVYFDNDLGKY